MMRSRTPVILFAFTLGVLLAAQIAGAASLTHPAKPAATPAVCREVVVNGGFEAPGGGQGVADQWLQESKYGYPLVSDLNPLPPSHWGAYLGGDDGSLDWISQSLTLPAGVETLNLAFWWALATEESPGIESDFLKAQLVRGDGVTVMATLVTVNNDSAANWDWNIGSADLSAYRGQSLQLRFLGTTDATLPTHFFVDEVSVLACSEDQSTGTPTPTATSGALTPTVTASQTPTASPTAEARAGIRLPLILR